jgi:ABC-type multidrug transport system ATPase subunit
MRSTKAPAFQGPVRRRTGVCPQFDVLWPELTAAEHLALHAAMKGFYGRSASQVRDVSCVAFLVLDVLIALAHGSL